MLQSNVDDLKETIKKSVSIYQESNLYTLSIDGLSVVTTKGPMIMNKIIESIIQVQKILSVKEKYEAPEIKSIPFDKIHRLTEPTVPMRASEINDIPDHLKGQMVCAYCWEPLFNLKTRKYYNYCPGCGRRVAE